MKTCLNLVKANLALRVKNPAPNFFDHTQFLDLAVLD